MQKLPLVFLVLGVVTGVLALFVGFYLFPNKLKAKISEQSRLEKGTARWDSWVEVPIPVFQKIYIFNVTNPKEVKKGAKPILEELGPYVYQQKRIKTDINVNEENDTISYRQHDDYFFRPDMSKGGLEDRITVPNLPFLGTVSQALEMGGVARYMVSEMFQESFVEEELYVSITVDEFLFKGYYVPFMEELAALKGGEELLPNHTFGLYYNKNSSESPVYEIYSGVKEPSKFGDVVSYDGNSKVDWYSEERCNKLIGSDGTVFPPFMTPDRDLYLFIPTLCRSLKFSYDSDTELLGIPGLRYTVPRSFLEDPRENPENRCYCTKPQEDFDNCARDGVWQISSCRKGTPVVMSMPHFYSASDYYLNQSIGLSPEKDKHEMHVIVEPTTSIAMMVSIRVQMNIDIKPTKYFKQMKTVPAMTHPVFWMEQGAGLNEEKAQFLKDKLIRVRELVELGTYVGLGIGGLFILIAILIYICRCVCCSNSSSAKTTYNPKKVSLRENNSYKSSDNFYDIPMKSEWPNGAVTPVTPTERYTTLSPSPMVMRPRMQLPEEEPLMFVNQQNGFSNFNNATVRTSPVPVVVAVYPKLSGQQQPQNSLYQKSSSDEMDGNMLGNPSIRPPVAPVPLARKSGTLGVPFPPKNEFSSTNSVENSIQEMDNTLKDIHDSLSLYENL